jgi:TonB family protein
MKLLISGALLLLLNTFLAAQDKIRYYKEDGTNALDEASAAYYRTVEKTADGKELHRYYWLPSKNKKEEGYYTNDKKTGVYKWYYRSGAPNAEALYGGENTRYIQFWSSEGKPLLTQGNGFVPQAATPGWNATFLIIEDSLLTCGGIVRPEKGDTLYSGGNIHAEYPGGTAAFNRELGQALVYPDAARRLGIAGTVMLEFVITKAGTLDEIVVIQGISDNCDAAAVTALKTLRPFKPATYKNKPVKVKMRLPLYFKLDGEDEDEDEKKGRKRKKRNDD